MGGLSLSPAALHAPPRCLLGPLLLQMHPSSSPSASPSLCPQCCSHGRVALVGHSAGGWLARILLGGERYQVRLFFIFTGLNHSAQKKLF